MVNRGCCNPEVISTDEMANGLQLAKKDPIDQGDGGVHRQNREMAYRLYQCLISLVCEPSRKFAQRDRGNEESISSVRP
jgi:hypothetical protein